jgi:hypothetical protein
MVPPRVPLCTIKYHTPSAITNSCKYTQLCAIFTSSSRCTVPHPSTSYSLPASDSTCNSIHGAHVAHLARIACTLASTAFVHVLYLIMRYCSNLQNGCKTHAGMWLEPLNWHEMVAAPCAPSNPSYSLATMAANLVNACRLEMVTKKDMPCDSHS